MMFSQKPVRVLIVDDSSLIRQMLTMFLASDPDIEVVGTAPDPVAARTLIKELNPDVLTLDVEMPHMDGLSFLEKIMTLRPMPVIMISSHTQANSEVTIKALEIGAVDFVAKPSTNSPSALEVLAEDLRAKVKAAAKVRLRLKNAPQTTSAAPPKNAFKHAGKIIFVGASTGGVEAIKELLSGFPGDCPPTLITQHMPERFTASFANRLNDISAMTVVEASHDLPIQTGHVYIAPGSHHLEIARRGNRFVCSLHGEAPVSGHRPSVDVLFRSAARLVGSNAVGAILTGMGKDGADGLLEMRKAGAITFGQDENTSLIYGMPQVAFQRGAVTRQHPLGKMADAILMACVQNTTSVR